MKLMCGIALVLGLLMLGEGIALGVMIAPLIAFAVRLALPLFDWAFMTQDSGENFPGPWWPNASSKTHLYLSRTYRRAVTAQLIVSAQYFRALVVNAS
jgi:hypothetical protein